MYGEALFSERQRFNQWWLWVLMLGMSLPTTVAMIWNLNKEPDTNPWILYGLALPPMLVFWGGFFLFIFRWNCLDTYIDHEGIHVKMAPFHRSFQHYSWEKLSGAHVRRYSALKEYGGWGYRIGFKGDAYNIAGNMGLQLNLKGTKRHLLIGTQRPKELQQALERLNKTDIN